MADGVLIIILDVRFLELVALLAVLELDERRHALRVADGLRPLLEVRAAVGLGNRPRLHLEAEVVFDVTGELTLVETLVGVADDLEIVDATLAELGLHGFDVGRDFTGRLGARVYGNVGRNLQALRTLLDALLLLVRLGRRNLLRRPGGRTDALEGALLRCRILLANRRSRERARLGARRHHLLLLELVVLRVLKEDDLTKNRPRSTSIFYAHI